MHHETKQMHGYLCTKKYLIVQITQAVVNAAIISRGYLVYCVCSHHGENVPLVFLNEEFVRDQRESAPGK